MIYHSLLASGIMPLLSVGLAIEIPKASLAYQSIMKKVIEVRRTRYHKISDMGMTGKE